MLFPWNTKTTDRKGTNKQNMYMQIKHSEKDNIEKGHYDFFFNWDSLHARLNSHYKAWSYKKSTKKITAYRKSV